MKDNQKWVCKLLLIGILVSSLSICFSSCKDKAKESSTLSKDATAVITEDGVTTLSEVEQNRPNLPDKDYNGDTFNIVSRDDSMHNYPVHTRDIAATEETGDWINDAVFRRNSMIEEKYNIKIKLTTFNEVSSELLANEAVEKAVRAGDDTYDLLLTHMINGGTSAQKGVFANWFEIPYIDFEKPYWCKGATDGLSVGNKMFLALSDLSLSSNDNTYCMLFNKKLLEEYNLENPYELVETNQWTMDKLMSMARDSAKDLDGDTKMTDADQYGLLFGGGQLNFMWAGGEHITVKDENNRPYLDMNTPKMVEIFEKVYRMRYEGNYTYSIASWIDEKVPQMFSENKAVFMTTQIGVIEGLRQMETDFGVLPYPKFDETQPNYGHYVDGHAPLMAVPTTVKDMERVGIIIEALSYESYKNVMPAYYNIILNTKYTRDNESSAMLDIIFNTRIFDFGYVYDNWKIAFLFNELLDGKKDNFVSQYEKKEKIAIKNFDKVLAAYDELDA